MGKILVLSNNCFSKTKNNGKTLYNIFQNLIKEKKVCSVYFSYENKEICIPTLNINEKILLGIGSSKNSSNSNTSLQPRKIKESHRLMREIIWFLLNEWKKLCLNFMKNEDVEVIFFLAGDSIFAYRIAMFLKKITNKRLVLYYTDDYLFKKHVGFFGWIRSRLLKYYAYKSINMCDDLFVISDKMKHQYDSRFGKEAKLLGITYSENGMEKKELVDKKNLSASYIGNLGLGRFEMIYSIAEIFNRINQKYDSNWKIKVFSGYVLNELEKKAISDIGTIEWKGYIDEEGVKDNLCSSDYIIFVESFLEEMIEITRYSFSTKIMEYLNYGNGIILHGPETSSSVEFLTECSIVLSEEDIDLIYQQLLDNKLRTEKQIQMKCKFRMINEQFISSKEYIESMI